MFLLSAIYGLVSNTHGSPAPSPSSSHPPIGEQVNNFTHLSYRLIEQNTHEGAPTSNLTHLISQGGISSHYSISSFSPSPSEDALSPPSPTSGLGLCRQPKLQPSSASSPDLDEQQQQQQHQQSSSLLSLSQSTPLLDDDPIVTAAAECHAPTQSVSVVDPVDPLNFGFDDHYDDAHKQDLLSYDDTRLVFYYGLEILLLYNYEQEKIV